MISLPHTHINKQIISAIMTLILLILIAIPISFLIILLWIYNDYRKYKRQNNLIIILLFLFPASLSAQYVDDDCRVSLKWYENQIGKLECSKDGLIYQFIPNSMFWKIVIKNNTSDDARINWANAQLIINGRASEINFGTITSENSSSMVKSQSELDQTISIIPSTINRIHSKLYDKRSIRRGNTAAVTIILPVSIGSQPQFFNTFDFVITQASK